MKGTDAKGLFITRSRTGNLLKGSSYILDRKERMQKMPCYMLCVEASLLHGAEREICWRDMLFVKGSSYSKMKGTDAKAMLCVEASLLHGAEREICW